MAGPGASRKMVTRAWWHAMASDEESRAHLQERLLLLSKLMFWSFVALLVLMVGLYARYPKLEPENQQIIYAVGLGGMVMLGALWRGVIERRKLSMGTLHMIDAFYAASSGATFASATCLAAELKMAMTANILWASFMVFLRAIVIPSTGRRTAVVGAIGFVPIVIASAILPFISVQEFPGEALVSSTLVVAGVVILLAAIGSRTIYSLRSQVNSAMRLGQYTLDRKIGEGGNGAVYRAHHALLRRPTAVKIIRPDRLQPEMLDRFEREVQHTSQLTHPNTVAVFDYGRSPDGLFYYAMEYLDGIDLEKLVAKFGAQPDRRVIAILIQVCGALHEAHNRGIIHRDIKPANIILCERGEVFDVAKVVDFGLAKELSTEQAKSGQIVGTPHYLAPESVTDPLHVGAPADLYALGCVGYFLVTGKRVFDGKHLAAAIKHVSEQPVPPSQIKESVSPELERVLLHCLAKAPGERPASARSLAELLRAVPSRDAWSDADAEAWWKALRAAPLDVDVTVIDTITVDLSDRAPETIGRHHPRTLTPQSADSR